MLRRRSCWRTRRWKSRCVPTRCATSPEESGRTSRSSSSPGLDWRPATERRSCRSISRRTTSSCLLCRTARGRSRRAPSMSASTAPRDSTSAVPRWSRSRRRRVVRATSRGWAPSARTSAAPAPPCTRSSITVRLPRRLPGRSAPARESGSPSLPGTVDREVYGGHVIEHRSSRPARWLRSHRLRFTLWIAVAEALLVVLHVFSWWLIVLAAAVAVGLWWYAGRRSKSDVVREGTWIAAASQLLVMTVPVLLFVATTIAVVLVVLLAIGALIILFT